MAPLVKIRPTSGEGGLAVRFILAVGAVYAAAAGIAFLLIRYLPSSQPADEAMFPGVFWISTALLGAGSIVLQRGVGYVRREKQTQFRRSLLAALVLGTAFVGVQICGLASLVRHQNPSEVETGANAFLTMISALHAMHLTLAMLLLVWITLGALADRYDHEYYWGVTVCAWFWHALGIVWGMILVVFLIATGIKGPRGTRESMAERPVAIHAPGSYARQAFSFCWQIRATIPFEQRDKARRESLRLALEHARDLVERVKIRRCDFFRIDPRNHVAGCPVQDGMLL
jgi:heme/copper-type cytochrome/quinol oxidase subunit 3